MAQILAVWTCCCPLSSCSSWRGEGIWSARSSTIKRSRPSTPCTEQGTRRKGDLPPDQREGETRGLPRRGNPQGSRGLVGATCLGERPGEGEGVQGEAKRMDLCCCGCSARPGKMHGRPAEPDAVKAACPLREEGAGNGRKPNELSRPSPWKSDGNPLPGREVSNRAGYLLHPYGFHVDMFQLVVFLILCLALLWRLCWFPFRPSSSKGEAKRTTLHRLRHRHAAQTMAPVLATWDIRSWKRPLESDPLVPFRLQERSGKDRIREHACISYVG